MVHNLEETIIDHYRIMQLLARGGMAKIYQAENIQTGEWVAIKVVHNNDENYYQRFRREVRAIAELQHEHILPALDWGEYGPWCYMVMPYIPHGTLTNRLLEGPLSLQEAGEILTQLAGALQHAHEHGIVHRDIKPSNVLMRDKHYAYLADFGLVKDTGTDHSLTQTGYLIGTPEYIAPEMLEGPANPVSDTYALGILLYQMLTGRVPFTGTTPVEIMWKHVQERPEPPSRLNPAIPPTIDYVVLKALEKKPKRRFQSPHALQQAYQNALSTLTAQEGVWKNRDTSMHHLRAITKQPLSQLLQPGMMQTYFTLLTQPHAIDIEDIPTRERNVVNVERLPIRTVGPAMLVGFSIVLLIVLSLLILSSGIFASHATTAVQTDHTTMQSLKRIPIKISILFTLPPKMHSSATRSVNSLPPLKPSLILKYRSTNRYQTQSNKSYDKGQDSDNSHYGGDGQGNYSGGRNDSGYEHGHAHGKHHDN